jgi:hypothetical protein
MKLRNVLNSLAAAAAICLSTSSWAGYVLSVDAPATGTVGSTVVVGIDLSLGAGEDLFGVNFTLNFNPLLLSYLGATEGASTSGWFATYFDDGLGGVTGSLLDPNLVGIVGSASAIRIADLSFKLSAEGTSPLALDKIAIADSLFSDPAANVVDGRILVQASSNTAPTPASLPLVALALVLLGWTRKHKATRPAG